MVDWESPSLALGMPGRLLKRFFSRLRFLTLSSCHPLLAPPPSNTFLSLSIYLSICLSVSLPLCLSLSLSLSLSLRVSLSFGTARVLLMIPINLELLGFPISQSEPAICSRLCLSAAFFCPARPNMDTISGKRTSLRDSILTRDHFQDCRLFLRW